MQVVCVDVPFSVTSVSYHSRLTDWWCHFYFIHRCPEYFTSALVSWENQVSEQICWKMEQQESWGVGGFVPELLRVCAYEYVFTSTYVLFHHYSWITKSALFLMESTCGLILWAVLWSCLAKAEILSHRKPGTLASCMEIPWRTSWREKGDFYQGEPDVVCAECLWWCLERLKKG